jgi:hypothetical protein
MNSIPFLIIVQSRQSDKNASALKLRHLHQVFVRHGESLDNAVEAAAGHELLSTFVGVTKAYMLDVQDLSVHTSKNTWFARKLRSQRNKAVNLTG